MASQQSPAKDINELSIDDIAEFMRSQFDPTRYIVRERFKFWSDLKRRPGESILELAARIRQDAVTCEFVSIKDPLDETMKTRFMCSVNNEAVLKALFKVKDAELTFAKAISVAVETEDAAKETVYGSSGRPAGAVNKVQDKYPSDGENSRPKAPSQRQKTDFPKGTCPRCGKTDHSARDCPFKEYICNFCKKTGHLQSVCLQKRKDSHSVKVITKQRLGSVKRINSVPQLQQEIQIRGQQFTFQVDTGAGDNFCSMEVWTKLGKPPLTPTTNRYEVANGQPLLTLGTFEAAVSLLEKGSTTRTENIFFTVSKVSRLNLLGRDAIVQLRINLPALLGISSVLPPTKESDRSNAVFPILQDLKPDVALQEACQRVCQDFPDLFKPELGCLKDLQLEIQFKPDSKPLFCKPRVVPFALQEDLTQAYDVGIAKGVWRPAQFNSYGTPVVPIRKKAAEGSNAPLRVCGDYSVTVNPQLEPHRYPMPLPDDLIRKLSGGYGFSKIDLADAFNQIISAPAHFQEIMDQLTSDLKGVAVYIDDILVSGVSAAEHLENLRALLQRLQDKGLRCRQEKCLFAQPSIEYLGFTLSGNGVAKGSRVDAIQLMPAPTDVSSLRSFLGSVQFYGKFLPNLATIRARWALLLNQYTYTIEYHKTSLHGNADALSRLPSGPDNDFDGEKKEADVDIVCAIKTIDSHLNPTDPGVLSKELSRDPVTAGVMRFTREGWPSQSEMQDLAGLEDYRRISSSLSAIHGCLLYGSRVVIPRSLQAPVLHILHLGHFGMQRMKQLARTAVYWPRIDEDIVNLCHRCSTCAEHQSRPPKQPNDPWMLPEKPWSRIHLDHAINFLGSNWLVIIDSYSKYPCIHPTTSVSSKATTDLLEQDVAHFGYPHTIVTDNSSSFLSSEFQSWCQERGIVHLTGAPYHPATNGAAERLVQTFKQALTKSSLPPKSALQGFLMLYRRTPLSIGYSPSELLNGRQIRIKIDVLLPSPAHIAQGKQAKEATKSQMAHVGVTWRRHLDQLRPRYTSQEDTEPGEPPVSSPKHTNLQKSVSRLSNNQDQVWPQTRPSLDRDRRIAILGYPLEMSIVQDIPGGLRDTRNEFAFQG
ncbi:hypothetical protein EMCRGX_G017577 [Ephydatia muelleri]